MSTKKHGRVVLIHGARFKKKDRDNLRRVATAFRATGFCVMLPTYGYLPAFLIGLIPWLDQRIAETMSGFINENDILLGHSNGGTLVYLISKRIKVRGAILVNAALDCDKVPDAEFVHVYFNAGDILTRFSAFVPFNPWGSMGGEGYKGDDPRVWNVDQGNPPEGLPPLSGHSDVFTHGKVRPWSRFMAEQCLKSINKLKVNHD